MRKLDSYIGKSVIPEQQSVYSYFTYINYTNIDWFVGYDKRKVHRVLLRPGGSFGTSTSKKHKPMTMLSFAKGKKFRISSNQHLNWICYTVENINEVPNAIQKRIA